MRGMYGIKGKSELPDLQPKKQESIPEEAKEREEVKLPPLHPRLLPPLSRPAPYAPLPHASQVPTLVHLSPIKAVSPKAPPEIEEDLDQQADGLLKWVEELPEEMSVSSSTHRLPIAL